jgi:hypothetical protein
MVFTPIYRAIDAVKSHANTLPDAAESNAEKFGPLKVVLGKIPALFANRTVRLWSPAYSSPFDTIFRNPTPWAIEL